MCHRVVCTQAAAPRDLDVVVRSPASPEDPESASAMRSFRLREKFIDGVGGEFGDTGLVQFQVVGCDDLDRGAVNRPTASGEFVAGGKGLGCRARSASAPHRRQMFGAHPVPGHQADAADPDDSSNTSGDLRTRPPASRLPAAVQCPPTINGPLGSSREPATLPGSRPGRLPPRRTRRPLRPLLPVHGRSIRTTTSPRAHSASASTTGLPRPDSRPPRARHHHPAPARPGHPSATTGHVLTVNRKLRVLSPRATKRRFRQNGTFGPVGASDSRCRCQACYASLLLGDGSSIDAALDAGMSRSSYHIGGSGRRGGAATVMGCTASPTIPQTARTRLRVRDVDFG